MFTDVFGLNWLVMASESETFGPICRTGLLRRAWIATLFDLLVSTSSDALESAAPASLDSNGRRER
jgi:hypothetical protein